MAELKQINQVHCSLNLNIRGLRQSATLAINERCRELAREGARISNLGLGQSPFPVPQPVVDALKLYAGEKDYLPVKGLRELRGAVAKFHREKDQIEADPDLVLVGPGSKELMFLLQLVFYGDIILPTPCWVSYVPQAAHPRAQSSLDQHDVREEVAHHARATRTSLCERERRIQAAYSGAELSGQSRRRRLL